MGIGISQYRASIGSFNSIISNSILKTNPTKNSTVNLPTYRSSFMKAIVLIPIMIGSLVIIYHTNLKNVFTCTNLVCRNPSQQIFDGFSSNIIPQNTLIPDISFSLQVLFNSLYSIVTNFQSRYTNGNRRASGIKIAHWNKGNSHLINKLAEIKTLVGQHHPHILGVSEANLLDVH